MNLSANQVEYVSAISLHTPMTIIQEHFALIRMKTTMVRPCYARQWQQSGSNFDMSLEVYGVAVWGGVK